MISGVDFGAVAEGRVSAAFPAVSKSKSLTSIKFSRSRHARYPDPRSRWSVTRTLKRHHTKKLECLFPSTFASHNTTQAFFHFSRLEVALNRMAVPHPSTF